MNVFSPNLFLLIIENTRETKKYSKNRTYFDLNLGNVYEHRETTRDSRQ